MDRNEKEFTRIVLASGRTIDPLKPTVEDVCLDDIAHGCAHTCRFAGHVAAFYSVADHQLNCSYVGAIDYGPRIALLCLIHDAAEYVLTDIPRPYKARIKGYKKYEKRLMEVIYEALDVPAPSRTENTHVKDVDNFMLMTEQEVYIPDTPYWPHIMDAEYVAISKETYGLRLPLGTTYNFDRAIREYKETFRYLKERA